MFNRGRSCCLSSPSRFLDGSNLSSVMGRVREHEVGAGSRLLATLLTSGVLLVGILGWMVAVGTMASPGSRFGENVLAPSASYASLGAAKAGGYATRKGDEDVNRDSRRRAKVEELDETNVRGRNQRDESGTGARPAADWDARGRKHAWLAEHGGKSHLDSMDWSEVGVGSDETNGGASEDEWDLGSVSGSGDDAHISLEQLQAQLSGAVTTDYSWQGGDLDLPKLGQDVATGESRTRGSGGKSKGLSKDASSRDEGGSSNTNSDLTWYDPAFVDSELEYRTRSGHDKMVAEFLNPPALNYTSETGRLRRLGRTLYLDGKPWLMRALCYSPVPVGWDPDWFEPFGDFFTSEYAGIYERDIPLIAAAGINTLRIYTLKYSHRHTHFFDLCRRYGVNIIVGYDFEDGTKTFFNDEASMHSTQVKIRALLRAAKHPAVVGWIIGNELNGPWNLYVCDKDLAENFGISACQFDDSIEKLMKSINLLCVAVKEEGMMCGTALANVNLPISKQHLVGMQMWGAAAWMKMADRYMSNLDFWGVNLYTRRYFSPMGLFQRFHTVSKKPMIISEYGVDAYSLSPQLEGWNAYDTMGNEDEVSQADWLITMVEDLERHATTCAAGCANRFISGGAIMSWVDEYWKGKAVTPVPTTDERVPVITRVCPSLKEYLHSPCGYASPTQPDLYVNEEWFGLMAVKKRCSINKVDLLRPRAAYYMLKMIWAEGGSCTPFIGQDSLIQPYDPEKYLNCGRAMKSYVLRTMETFMRAEAEAFHEIKLRPDKPVPIFAHFENFSVQLNHPKSVINPVSSNLQSTFLTCHAQQQIHKRSPQTCPPAPKVMDDVVGYVTRSITEFTQPGDTSCPQQEQIDAMKLEVQVKTVLAVFVTVYLVVALLMKRKQLRRMTRDALISLSRSGMAGASWLVTSPAPDELAAKQAADALLSTKPVKNKSFQFELINDPAVDTDDKDFNSDEPRLSRRGPELNGNSVIEQGVEAWRVRLTPMAKQLGQLFGFQSSESNADATDSPASTIELVTEKLAKNLWNLTQITECPVVSSGKNTANGAPAVFAVDKLHQKTFAGYDRWLGHTKFSDVSTPGQPVTLGQVHGPDAPRKQPSGADLIDTKLYQIALFELIYSEAANLRLTPEMVSFTYHLGACAVQAPSKQNNGTASAVKGSGLNLPEGDFVESVITPFHAAIVESMTLGKRLNTRVGYDDVNELFWTQKTCEVLFQDVQVPAEQGNDPVVSAYARFRHFLRTSNASNDKDQRLSSVFKKTFREHQGWGAVFVNFHRMFTFLSIAFHLLVVHAFVGFKQPAMFASAGITAAFCAFVLETHALFIHGQQLMWSKTTSYARFFVAIFVLLGTPICVSLGFSIFLFFAAFCAPYLLFSLIEIWGVYPLGGPDPDADLVGKKSTRDLAVDDPRDTFSYRLFWTCILVVKFAMDYVFIVHALVTPSKAIMQIDLYCWNYNFAGEDCDQYDYAEAIPVVAIQAMRLFRRYAYKLLMLFERWLPNLMLYYCNTFFYYLAALGFASAFHRLRWRGVADGWSKVVRDLPTRVAAFEKRVLTTDSKPLIAPSNATVLCTEAVSETWDVFAKAWNEVVKSLRDRDLLSDEELSLLLFSRLKGNAVNAFFGNVLDQGGSNCYLLFPAMLAAPVFSKAGASRNVNMTYSMLPAVFSQTVDTFTFVFTAVLGVADATSKQSVTESLNVAFNLIACAVVRRQAVAADTLVALRGRAIVAFTALRAAAVDPTHDLVPEHVSAAGAALDSIFTVITDVLADDRELEDQEGKQVAESLRNVVARLRTLLDFTRCDDATHVVNHVAKTIATHAGRTAVEHVFVTLTTANPAAEPASPEARDVLRFFLESFTDPQLERPAVIGAVPSLVTLTPLYKEEIMYSASHLSQRVDGENVSTLRFLISMMPTEWSAMLQRCGLKLPGQDYETLLTTLHDSSLSSEVNVTGDTKTDSENNSRLLQEIIKWSSGRSQTMFRTVRGMAAYADATRVLARLENVEESEIEPLVRVKYNHVVCAQVYGTDGNEQNDEALEELLRQYPHLSIVTAHREDEGDKINGTSENFKWFVTRRVADASGQITQTHRIALPGFPIVGEGKPENQNLGMAFCEGLYVQTIDMNQDCQLAEALKMRNALCAFAGDTRLVGFPEQVITDRSGSVAAFAALSEQVFGTIVQRFMAKPLNVRFHYGHPDVWDLSWIKGQGGVSKASRQLHLSEDIFGGINLVLRGGRVKYLGFMMVGKAREVSFDGTNQFNFKISSGNGMQLISRDFHRMAKRLDLFRMLSFFQSSAGIFFAEFLLFASLAAFVVCKLMIAMLHIETFFGDGDAFDSVGFHEEVGLEMLYPSQWMIQASLVMAWPSMLEGWLDGGLVKMFQRFYEHAASGSHLFNMFIAKTRGFAIDHTVLSGKALYQVTKRGMNMKSSFVSLYTRYASSHITPSMHMATHTLMLTFISRFGAQYVFVMTTWHVWFAIACLTLSPWLFHPQSFKEGMVWHGFVEWACWIDFGLERSATNKSETGEQKTGVPGTRNVGSWHLWNAERLKAMRQMPISGKFDYIMYRLLPVPVMLLFGSCAALQVDDIMTKPTLRGVVVLTAGVAGVLLSTIYYLATSPSFLWPRRLLDVANRLAPNLTVTDKHFFVLLYGVVLKVVVVIFHHLLCAHLFQDAIDSTDGSNRVIFFSAGFFVVSVVVGAASLIGDNSPAVVRPLSLALRHFSDGMLREVDVVQGLVLHVSLGLISLLPVSYLHGKILFNRAYAAVLSTEMRRRSVISNVNTKSAVTSLSCYYLKVRNFTRKVLGLRTVRVQFTRPLPSTVPNVKPDLTQAGPNSSNSRADAIKARITPIAESLATNFGLQMSAMDDTFTDVPVEVQSNLGNAVESLTHWLCNAMDSKPNIVLGKETESQFRDVVEDLHAHLFQNYLHWGEYTGMLDRAKESARMGDRWGKGDGLKYTGPRSISLAAFMAADNDAMWDKSNREQSISVMSNAHVHHLMLWFLLYGERANLRHTSEVMCFIFHAAMCGLMLEDKAPQSYPVSLESPNSEQLVIAQPVEGSEMSYPKDDYLNSVVRPLYAFLQREVQGRASSPIVDRVMYDDVNECFWLRGRGKVVLPPEDGYAGAPILGEEQQSGWIGVPESMRHLPVEPRMYAHFRSFLQTARDSKQGPALYLSKTFFKTYREVAGWMSMFVNFNTVFLFHAVAFHVSMAYVFAHGWNWAYVSTATITHSMVKLAAEIATLHFRNLSKESGGDWAVTMTRIGAFAMIPVFFALERFGREDGNTPYFQALAAVYAVAFAGVGTSSVRREPYMGSAQQLATPFKERFVYTCFWVCVLSVKLTFGHYLLVKPLREAVMALQHPDLCWNKESDEYTSCINLEGDQLMNALRFTPKTTYFTETDPDEEDYEELEEIIDNEPLDSLENMEEVKDVDELVTGRGGKGGRSGSRSTRPSRLKARRRFLLSSEISKTEPQTAPVTGGKTVSYYFDQEALQALDESIDEEGGENSSSHRWQVPRQVAADAAYKGYASVSYSAMDNCQVVDGAWGGDDCLPDFNTRKTLPLPKLGYIGEEVEGELPEAYYDVHASVELMWIMTVIRAAPAVTTYFCDTFLWYTFFATMFTVFLQWRGKITHAQNWAFLLKTFGSIPNLFCEKLLNREWPTVEVVRSDTGSGGGHGSPGSSGSEGVHGSTGSHDPLGGTRLLDLSGGTSSVRNRSGGRYNADGAGTDFVIELPSELTDVEGSALTSGADPTDFLPEACDVKQQHFARAWNAIIADLRCRDHLSDAERDDLSYHFLQGGDVEQVFDAAEYIILPNMITSPVFSSTSLDTGRSSSYASFTRTLIQTKDLMCVLFTEVLQVPRTQDMHTLMRIMVDLSRVEAEQMGRRRMDDVDGYIQLREACASLLMALQALGAATVAKRAPDEDQDDDSPDNADGDELDSDDDVDLDPDAAGLTEAEREARRRRASRRDRRRQKRRIKAAEQARESKLVEAINLEMKYGCTGFLSRGTRKSIKKRGGPMLGCFVVDEDLEGAAIERREELREIERAERRDRGLPSEDSGYDDDGDSNRRSRRRRRQFRKKGGRERKWSELITPDDLLKVHGERLANALHDVLLAVRELCSFALEQDGRWSSVNNQRKYRISQLYSSLLDIVKSDALRDAEHLRKVAAAATTTLSQSICAALLRSFHSSNPGGQPRSEEAQRQLMFFCNSLRFTSLKTPTPLQQVKSWTPFTPYYAEDVKYRIDELTTPLEDEKTLFSLIVATFQHDFDNFKERIRALGTDDDVVLREHWAEAQTWASDRTQSLSRCVRGVTLYGSALRLLARLEGYDDATAETLVRSKFEFLVSAQIFGKQRQAPSGSMDKFKADAIEELIKDHADLKVCFVHVPKDTTTEDFASCLIGRDEETDDLKIDFKVKLPGNPIIGEGKPENQNQAVIFARGAYLQTLDMNQDNYMGESYKMRNLLDCFHGDVVLVGVPETIFSETHGAVAQFAAISEFIFQTFQRFMTWPLMVRFHYGHPDVWDKAFTMTNGGVSKASRAIHVAEDFFGGVNAIARGGKVIFEEFIECGKGRDMGFTSVNGFEQKISGSSGTISMSRDLFRLHRGMDMLRVFSLFFSGPGFFISMMQTAWCVYLYILAHATLAVADLEIYRVYRYFKMTETQTSLSLSKEEGGYYNSIYAIQLGLLTVLPLFLKMTVDRGLRDGFEYTVSSLIQGSWAFNVFTMATKGYNYARALIFGQAHYIGTERGYVLQNASMVVLYGLYAKSHLYQGLELFVYLLLFHTYTSLPKSLLYSWSVWMFAGSVVIAPWWFSPQATNLFWMQNSWSDWRRWIDGNFPDKKTSHGSWANWHAHMLSPWREILSPWYKVLVVFSSGVGRIVLTLVCVASLHGNTQIENVAQISQFGVNALRMSFAVSFTLGICVLYYIALRSTILNRKPWLSFPEHLWKLSVYRGIVRVCLIIAWFGLYAIFMYDEVESVSSSRTLAMTLMGCVSICACITEGWAMIGDRDIDHIFDFAMPPPDTSGDTEKYPQNTWRHTYAKPCILFTRGWLKKLRDFADFWFCELDKLCGGVIFGILFVFSLLPIASVQAMLIWNETFSDVIKQRVRVNECIQEIIE